MDLAVELDRRFAPGEHGLQLKRVAGGITILGRLPARADTARPVARAEEARS